MSGGHMAWTVIMNSVPQRTIRPIPAPDDLLKLALAAFSDAKDLLVAARQLADVGSFPPAHALATFAAEEQSKSQLCFMVILLLSFTADPADPEFSAVFWDEFYEHKRKLVRVQAFRAIRASAAASLGGEAHPQPAAYDCGRSRPSAAWPLRRLSG